MLDFEVELGLLLLLEFLFMKELWPLMGSMALLCIVAVADLYPLIIL